MRSCNVLRPNQFLILEGSGVTVSIALGASAAFQQGFLKASPDDPVHPGWPAGTPGGLAGKFRPKDGSARETAETAINRAALRRAIRTLLTQALSLPFEVAANVIPALGEAADVIMVGQLAETASEFQKLNAETQAALDFIANGPYDLDALRVSPSSESFSSYNQFYKGLSLKDILALRFGSAGAGYQYHHIVEQGGSNNDLFSAQELQSTDNIIRIPTLLHEAINSIYSKPSAESKSTLRDQLRTEPFSKQREEGIQILRDLVIIR